MGLFFFLLPDLFSNCLFWFFYNWRSPFPFAPWQQIDEGLHCFGGVLKSKNWVSFPTAFRWVSAEQGCSGRKWTLFLESYNACRPHPAVRSAEPFVCLQVCTLARMRNFQSCTNVMCALTSRLRVSAMAWIFTADSLGDNTIRWLSIQCPDGTNYLKQILKHLESKKYFWVENPLSFS